MIQNVYVARGFLSALSSLQKPSERKHYKAKEELNYKLRSLRESLNCLKKSLLNSIYISMSTTTRML